MLFKARTLEQIAAGEVTVAFRRWKRPQARTGSRLRTGAGVLAVDDVRVVPERDIGEADAVSAGYASREELLHELSRRNEGELYRVDFHLDGDDPRMALRNDAELDDDEVAHLQKRLARFDRSRDEPWTERVLRLIGARPGVRAGDLAAELGRETQPFKLDVRKLKELGLTESLEVGYRLSPRGRAFLDRLGRSP